MTVISGGKRVYDGKTYYVNPEDVAKIRGLDEGEWESYNPRKHPRNGSFKFIKPTFDDFVILFPEDFGEVSEEEFNNDKPFG